MSSDQTKETRTSTTAKKTKSKKKKSTAVHTKRTQIEDEEGWTHVVDAPRRSKNGGLKKGQVILHGGDFEVDGVSYINRTLEEMKAEFEYWKKSWEEDSACLELKEKLQVFSGVENVVFLGMGSLQSSRREGRRASATQLAALQTIITSLGEENGSKVILQDPQYTALDKEFLTSLGYGVVEDPEAFKEIGEGSLVYAIHCYAKVYKAVSDGKRPKALIGTDVGNFGRFNLSGDAEATAKSLESMVEGCEVVDFPQVRHDFSDTKIYWRKGAKSEAADQPPPPPLDTRESSESAQV